MIIVENLYLKEIKKYISLTFDRGINFLEAPNGSGKSIFLDYLSGIRKAKIGTINYNNYSVIYLRQNFGIHPRLKVEEYVNFILKMSNSSWKEFYNFIEMYDLNTFFNTHKNKTIGILSGGERRLIYILSILYIDRDCYILDEPFNNLDEEKFEKLINIIMDLCSKGKSFIITSHISLKNICNQRIVFNNYLKS